MAGHHARLTTNDDQNSAVAEDEDQQDDDVEGQEIPDPVGHLSRVTLKHVNLLEIRGARPS